MRRRRFRAPVLSRLTLAWAGFAVAACAASGYFLFADARPSETVLAVTDIERIARQEEPPSTEPERLTQPALVEADNSKQAGPEIIRMASVQAPRTASLSSSETTAAISEPYSLETSDQIPLAAPVGPTPGANLDAPLTIDDTGDEVIITVDGKPARAPGQTTNREEQRRRRAVASIVLANVDIALTSDTDYGRIPAIARDGRRPAEHYARPFTKTENPPVALIVGGLGLNRDLTERAITELPPQISLAFAPYARDLDYWTKRARDAGHEVLLELPMENGRGDETALGPAALLTNRTTAENIQRLDWLLSRYRGYVGVTNYLGAKFSGNEQAMRPVLQKITRSGLSYFDDTGAVRKFSGRGSGSVGEVNRLVAPGYNGDLGKTRQDLKALERLAKKNGSAIGKTHVYASSLTELAEWGWSLEEEDLTLAPASAILKLRNSGA